MLKIVKCGKGVYFDVKKVEFDVRVNNEFLEFVVSMDGNECKLFCVKHLGKLLENCNLFEICNKVIERLKEKVVSQVGLSNLEYIDLDEIVNEEIPKIKECVWGYLFKEYNIGILVSKILNMCFEELAQKDRHNYNIHFHFKGSDDYRFACEKYGIQLTKEILLAVVDGRFWDLELANKYGRFLKEDGYIQLFEMGVDDFIRMMHDNGVDARLIEECIEYLEKFKGKMKGD